MAIRLGRIQDEEIEERIEESTQVYRELVSDVHTKLNERYPLLSSIDTRVNHKSAKTLADYMGAIDLALETVPSFKS